MPRDRGPSALRRFAERTQEPSAESFGVQPAVQEIERQPELYLSTPRHFVEAAGGTLELVVTLPGTGAVHLTGLGETTEPEPA